MDTKEELLGKVGLGKQEGKVYIGLLELKQARTGALCRHTGIASSNIYQILGSLLEKGLVSYRVQNNVRVFMPAPPETLNELFQKKRAELDQERKTLRELIARLKRKEAEREPYADYKYYEGLTGIKALWYEINEVMDKGSIIRGYTAKREGYERLVGFYNAHHELRKKKGVKERLIFPKEDVKLAKKRGDALTEVRFMDLQNEAEWGVVKDRVYIQYITGKRPRGFLIRDEIFAKTFRQVFDQIWERAKL